MTSCATIDGLAQNSVLMPIAEVKMNKPRLASILVTVMSVLVLSLALMAPSAAYAAGGGQISGLAFYPDPYPGVCNQLESLGASYVVRMTGDLQGCHYSFVDTSVCTPGGA